jgi:hypothetical protein
MTSGVAVICFLIAFIFFVLAAIGIAWPRLNFVAAGLAAFSFPFLYVAFNAHF